METREYLMLQIWHYGCASTDHTPSYYTNMCKDMSMTALKTYAEHLKTESRKYGEDIREPTDTRSMSRLSKEEMRRRLK